MTNVYIRLENTARKGKKIINEYALYVPIKLESQEKIVAKSKISKKSLYAYAIIHCKRLGFDYFYDETVKVQVNTLK